MRRNTLVLALALLIPCLAKGAGRTVSVREGDRDRR